MTKPLFCYFGVVVVFWLLFFQVSGFVAFPGESGLLICGFSGSGQTLVYFWGMCWIFVSGPLGGANLRNVLGFCFRSSRWFVDRPSHLGHVRSFWYGRRMGLGLGMSSG